MKKGPQAETSSKESAPPAQKTVNTLFKSRFLDPTLFNKCCCTIGVKLLASGWNNFLCLRVPIYNNLVIEFYKNLVVDPEQVRVTSKVKGLTIEIGETQLGEVLKLPTEGVKAFSEIEIHNEPEYDAIIEEMRSEHWKGEISDRSQLSLEYRVFHNIVSHMVTQRSGSFNHVSALDLFIMFMVRTGRPFSLPYILMKLMITYHREGRSFLPFGSILTEVLKTANVPLEGEPSVDMGDKAVFNMSTVKLMGLRAKADGTLYERSGEEPRVDKGNSKDRDIHIMKEVSELSAAVEEIKENQNELSFAVKRIEENQTEILGMLKALKRSRSSSK